MWIFISSLKKSQNKLQCTEIDYSFNIINILKIKKRTKILSRVFNKILWSIGSCLRMLVWELESSNPKGGLLFLFSENLISFWLQCHSFIYQRFAPEATKKNQRWQKNNINSMIRTSQSLYKPIYYLWS